MPEQIEEISSIRPKSRSSLPELQIKEERESLEVILAKYKQEIQTKGIDLVLGDLVAGESRLRLSNRTLFYDLEKIETKNLDDVMNKKIGTYDRLMYIVLPTIQGSLNMIGAATSSIYAPAGGVFKALGEGAGAANNNYSQKYAAEREGFGHTYSLRGKLEESYRQDKNDSKQSFQQLQELIKRVEETHGRLWEAITNQ